MGPAGSLVPGGRSFQECCLSSRHVKMSKEPPHFALQIVSKSLFPCYVHGLFALPSLQKDPQYFWALLKPSLLTFRTPGFKSCCLQELMKFDPSSFPSQLLWGFISTCVFQSMFYRYPSLKFPFYHGGTICFSTKLCLSTSCLLQYGLFSAFSCGGYSASLKVNFWDIYDDLIVTQCICGTR